MISTSIARLEMAVLNLPNANASRTNGEAIAEFVELFVYPEDATIEAPIHAAIDSSGEVVSVYVRNGRKALAQQVARLAQANQYDPIELKLLQRAFGQIPDASLSAFLHMRGEGRDTGWLMEGLFPLKTALELVPDGELETKLAAWYNSVGVDACTAVGRSLGGGYTILHTYFAGESVGEDIEYYQSLCSALGLDALPAPILQLIASDLPDPLQVRLHLTKNAVVKLGLYVEGPGLGLIQNAMLAFDGGNAFETVGTFEGSLGAQTAEGIEFFQDARGFNVRLYYTPKDTF